MITKRRKRKFNTTFLKKKWASYRLYRKRHPRIVNRTVPKIIVISGTVNCFPLNTMYFFLHVLFLWLKFFFELNWTSCMYKILQQQQYHRVSVCVLYCTCTIEILSVLFSVHTTKRIYCLKQIFLKIASQYMWPCFNLLHKKIWQQKQRNLLFLVNCG
jgi:hypothetical protein